MEYLMLCRALIALALLSTPALAQSRNQGPFSVGSTYTPYSYYSPYYAPVYVPYYAPMYNPYFAPIQPVAPVYGAPCFNHYHSYRW
jgi:hypothetical protein